MLALTSWIYYLWEMSCKYDVTIDGHYEKTCPIRISNKALMNIVVESNEISNNEIIKINYCRLHFQVHNLSNITNGFGSHINYSVIHHIRDPDKVSTYNWPFQPNPSKYSWGIWEKAIDIVWSHSE